MSGTTGEYETNRVWFEIGPLELQLGILVDGLTGVMLVVVTSVSLMVQIYSLGYMKGDVRFTWFYFVLSMFTGAMLIVVDLVERDRAAGRLGDHGRVLVPVDRPLVRGTRELERRDQGVHHHPDRRRPDDVRVLLPDRGHRLRHDEHQRDHRGDRERRGEHGVRRGGRPAAVRRHDRQVRAVPAARVAARRDGRPHAGERADPRRHDGRGRRLPARAAVRGVRGRRPVRPHDRGDRGGDHDARRGASSRSPRTTSNGSSRTRRCRSWPTWSPGSAWAPRGTPPGSSTCSPTRSSRRCCSWVRGR